MPFLGLSVIIHLFVIGSHRIFKWSERAAVSKSRKLCRKPSVRRHLAGGTIIMGVFSIIFGLGVTLVHVCMMEDHASVTLVQDLWSGDYTLSPTSSVYGFFSRTTPADTLSGDYELLRYMTKQ